MGYYSWVDFDIVLVNGTSEERFLKEFKEKYKDDANLDFWLEKFVFEDGQLNIEACAIKFYDYDKFAATIAPFVEGIIDVVGEESDDKWKIEFDGKGKWKEIGSTVIYGYEPYKNFMKECGPLLPKKLKEDLEKWKLAQDI